MKRDLIEVIMKVSRKIYENTKYEGDADSFVNMPITVDDKPVGVITEVVNSDDDYMELKGVLFKSDLWALR